MLLGVVARHALLFDVFVYSVHRKKLIGIGNILETMYKKTIYKYAVFYLKFAFLPKIFAFLPKYRKQYAYTCSVKIRCLLGMAIDL